MLIQGDLGVLDSFKVDGVVDFLSMCYLSASVAGQHGRAGPGRGEYMVNPSIQHLLHTI